MKTTPSIKSNKWIKVNDNLPSLLERVWFTNGQNIILGYYGKVNPMASPIFYSFYGKHGTTVKHDDVIMWISFDY